MEEIDLTEVEDDTSVLKAVSPHGSLKSHRSIIKDIRVAHQPGFVLHSYPYKETSLIVDVLTRDYGRLMLVAKGAKRPHSKLRSVLQTFQPLTLSWTGKSEIRTMTAADWVGGMLPLEKSALLCGYYLNELLIKFCVRDEVNRTLFDLYVATLNQLAHNESAPIVLRKFELALLQECGLLGSLHLCSETHSQVVAEIEYIVDPLGGVRPARQSDSAPKILGKTLTDMHTEVYADPLTLSQSKQLMRFLLNHHLNGLALKTRQILIDLHKL